MASRCESSHRFRSMCRLAARSDCIFRRSASVPWRAEPIYCRGKRMVVSRLMLFLAGLLALMAPASAAAPEPTAITPELVAAAKQGGSVVWYTSIALPTAGKLAKSFEAAYPGIKVQVERNGAERNFQRIAQERGSNIHAVDAAEASDMGSFILWKRQGWLAPFVPQDVADTGAAGNHGHQ